MKIKKKYQWLLLLLSILLCLFIGVLGSIFMGSEVHTWYKTLKKPLFTPPDHLFGPVWTILYILMGYSIWKIIITKTQGSKKTAYTMFSAQIFLNCIWSFLFFTIHNPQLALLDILVLWLLIIGTIVSFYKIAKPAAYALIPYLLWVSFAVYLNASFHILNP